MIPFWKVLPAQWAHDLAPLGVHLWSELFPVHHKEWRPFEWRGLWFTNRLGLAGGADKNADLLPHWVRLGFGFVEVGTVTPEPQEPNPGRIVDRDWNEKLIWNRMGFPSAGMSEVALQIRSQQPVGVPLFVNVGKNRTTANSDAAEDYALAASRLAPEADVVVVNISSPNTQGLRDLQDQKYLRFLIEKTVLAAAGKPVLVKFSPDEDESSLRESLSAATEAGAAGFILTNTTLQRPADSRFPREGGLSGAFLNSLSRRSLEIAASHFRHDREKTLLVSVGGLLGPQEIKERLDLGADLVQVYSALIFHGPGFPGQVARFMREKELAL